MKIILTGATGFIGGAVLQRCILHPSITSIVTLTRRELSIKHEKLHAIILADFLTYRPEVLAEFEGAEACIWCLGRPTAGREVQIEYTMAGIQAIHSTLTTFLRESNKRFKFIYLSGALSEREQSKSLCFLSEARKTRGEIESKILEFEQRYQDEWKSVVAKPWGVMSATPIIIKILAPKAYIPVGELAAALVDIAISGEGDATMDNADLRRRGQVALKSD